MIFDPYMQVNKQPKEVIQIAFPDNTIWVYKNHLNGQFRFCIFPMLQISTRLIYTAGVHICKDVWEFAPWQVYTPAKKQILTTKMWQKCLCIKTYKQKIIKKLYSLVGTNLKCVASIFALCKKWLTCLAHMKHTFRIILQNKFYLCWKPTGHLSLSKITPILPHFSFHPLWGHTKKCSVQYSTVFDKCQYTNWFICADGG